MGSGIKWLWCKGVLEGLLMMLVVVVLMMLVVVVLIMLVVVVLIMLVVLVLMMLVVVVLKEVTVPTSSAIINHTTAANHGQGWPKDVVVSSHSRNGYISGCHHCGSQLPGG